MAHHRRGLKLGKLFIPQSTLNGIGKVAGRAATDVETDALAPARLMGSLGNAIGGKGGPSIFIIAIIGVGGFIAYKYVTK